MTFVRLNSSHNSRVELKVFLWNYIIFFSHTWLLSIASDIFNVFFHHNLFIEEWNLRNGFDGAPTVVGSANHRAEWFMMIVQHWSNNAQCTHHGSSVNSMSWILGLTVNQRKRMNTVCRKCHDAWISGICKLSLSRRWTWEVAGGCKRCLA